MELFNFLRDKKEAVAKRWYDRLAATYPADTARFLRTQKDRFTNPVGASFYPSLVKVLEGIIAGADRDYFISSLDPIIRTRALQKFTPSEALSFVAELKQVVREMAKKQIGAMYLDQQLGILDEKIEELLFISFDIYTGCREQLARIRVEDEKRRLHMLLRRAKLIVDNAETGIELPDLRDSDE